MSYGTLLCYFDPLLNLAVNGDVCFHLAEYPRAAQWYERAIASGDAPVWVYWNGACAWAQAGDLDRSLALLNLAVDGGLRDADRARGSEHLKPLHGTPGWDELLGRLEQGGGGG